MFLATSFDGWLLYTSQHGPRELKRNAAIEIKSPTSPAMWHLVQSLRDEFGEFTECTLVYKDSYRAQVMHHAAVCDLDKVLSVVANEFKPIYATMITVPSDKHSTY